MIEKINEAFDDLPLPLPEFLKKDIPPLEYYVMDILPKKGKGLISAPPNLGKSIFVQNMALDMATFCSPFMNKFSVEAAIVLYIDLEMGESALKERFLTMSNVRTKVSPNLYIKHMPVLNLLADGDRAIVEAWIKELSINVIILDPVGNAWLGNENDSEKVRALTAYLNTLIDKYNVSVLLVHHWRKATKDNRTGGQMAAGSYRWEAWADCHITLEGQSISTTISCHKNRNRPKFSPFLAKLNEETLSFEFVADFQKKFTDDTLQSLFNLFDIERVAIPDLIKRAKDQKICSQTTLRGLIKDSKLFRTDDTGKTHYLMKISLEEEI